MQKLVWQNANGVELDLTSGNYGITEWEGFSNASLNIQSQQVPFQDGGVFLDALIEQRELSVTLAMQDNNNLELRYQQRRELISALNPKLGEGYLIYTNDFISKRIKCVPQIPIFETHNSDTVGTPKASLSWTACSPYWEDLEETIVELPTSTPIENNGDVPCQIKAVLNAGASNPVLFNRANNKEIGLSGIFDFDVEVNTNYGEKGIQTVGIGYQWVCGGDFLSCCYGAGKFVFAGSVNMIQELFTGKTYAFDVGTGRSIEKIRYINNMFYALSGGYVCRSKDGVNWSNIQIAPSQVLKDIIFAKNQYVVVGGSGTIMTSPDGTSWTSQTSGVSTYLNGIVFANNMYVAVGNSGTIITSSNGTSWTSRTSGTNNGLQGITFANNIFVAVGNTKTILTSANGTTWTSQTTPSSPNNYFAVGSAEGKIYALGNGNYATSTDGITWTASDSFGYLRDIMSVYNKHYICGDGGIIMYSEDGVNWNREGSGVGSNDMYDVVYVEGLFVACGVNEIYTSENGKIWTQRTSGAKLFSVCYGNERFIAVGSEGKVYSSADGETWSYVQLSVSENLYRIRYVNNTFIISGAEGTLITSTDGETWTIRTSGTLTDLWGVAYGNNMYVVGGVDSVLISTDLETWTPYSLPVQQGSCRSITFANGMFVLGSERFGNVCTSTDGQTWIIQYEAPEHAGSVNVEYLNNMFVLVNHDCDYILTSKDGLNYNPSARFSKSFYGVAYGQDKFVFVGSSGIIYNSYIAGNKNIIADLTPESDMTFNLEQGENEILYITDGNTQATLTYRQKYIGV